MVYICYSTMKWNLILLIILLVLWKMEFVGSSLFLLLLVVAMWIYTSRKYRKVIGKRDLVVITGCDTGLGFSLAHYCYEHLGVQVLAGVHRADSAGSQKLSKIGIRTHPLDLTDRKSMNLFVLAINSYLKNENLNLCGIVNNAGTMVFGEFEWQTDEQIYHQVAVNLLGTMRLTKELLPLLRKYKSRLIIVTSHCACEPLPGVAAYGAAKAGLTAWATALRVELCKYGVDVINFIPGSFILQSNLLSQQRKHFDSMVMEMTAEAKGFYSEYFKRYADYLTPISRPVDPQKIDNPQLHSVFESALLDKNPRATYKCEPWRYKFYHFLFKITTTQTRDWLVEKFVMMPTWKVK